MKILGAGSLSSRLRILLNVVLGVWLLWGILDALFMLLIIAFPTHAARHWMNLTTLYNIPDGVCDPGTFLTCSDSNALIGARTLAFVNYRSSNRLFLLGMAIASLMQWGMYLVIIQQLRRVFASLTSGQPFLRTNARRLRIIGWVMIVAILFEYALIWAAASAMRSTLTLAGHTPTVPIEFIIDGIHPERLFVGVTVLVLAEIFRVGAGLQEEQSLTV